MARTEKNRGHNQGWPLVVKVGGHTVKFKERFPTDEAALDAYAAITAPNAAARLRGLVKHLPYFVESWDFEGDPHQPDAWGQLDFWRETLAVVNALDEYLAALLGEAGISPTP